MTERPTEAVFRAETPAEHTVQYLDHPDAVDRLLHPENYDKQDEVPQDEVPQDDGVKIGALS